MTNPSTVRMARIKLIALLAVFILPVVAATLLHHLYKDTETLSVSSNGELITPAVPLESFELRNARGDESIDQDWLQKRWTLVYLAPAGCSEVCEKNLYHMRQIHNALGKEAHRVQRLAVAMDVSNIVAFIGQEYPGLMLTKGADDAIRAFYQQFERAVQALPAQQESLYLIDPLGNLMMRFSPELNPKGILKDIKRALRVSRIG